MLDRQLQETIYQFERTHGVVAKIDQDSKQLAEALAGEHSRIVITTTDVHLPRRIGEALKDAHQGELDVRFGDNEYSVRVVWHR